jgi:Xaa-Pro aminopeptidase
MRYTPINNELFIENRKKLCQLLPSKSIVVLNANDLMPKSADGTMAYIQQTDLFYLSGIEQEESILVLCPDAQAENMREILFLRKTNEHIEIWEGYKLSKQQAFGISGIKNIQWLDEFESIFKELMFQSEHVFLNTNEHLRATVFTQTRDARFINWCKENYPLHSYKRIAPIMHEIRAIKNNVEVELIQKAIDITEKAFRRVLAFTKPNLYEYQIEAELIHEFINNGSRRHAFEPIIASGENACILHYNNNDKICRAGELVLLDFGCEYANYNSDITRVIPVNGRFTERQKQVYQAVLNVQRFAMTMLVSGTYMDDYLSEVGRFMTSELISLRLLDKHDVAKQNPDFPLYKQYFMHGTSHHLGLDVHDYGSKYKPFQAGMVFTCEPGIYIPKEKIGIRLENDLLITEKGNIDLAKNIPIEIEEIESLMNS